MVTPTKPRRAEEIAELFIWLRSPNAQAPPNCHSITGRLVAVSPLGTYTLSLRSFAAVPRPGASWAVRNTSSVATCSASNPSSTYRPVGGGPPVVVVVVVPGGRGRGRQAASPPTASSSTIAAAIAPGRARVLA